MQGRKQQKKKQKKKTKQTKSTYFSTGTSLGQMSYVCPMLPFFWIVHFWLSLWYSLTFIHMGVD